MFQFHCHKRFTQRLSSSANFARSVTDAQLNVTLTAISSLVVLRTICKIMRQTRHYCYCVYARFGIAVNNCNAYFQYEIYRGHRVLHLSRILAMRSCLASFSYQYGTQITLESEFFIVTHFLEIQIARLDFSWDKICCRRGMIAYSISCRAGLRTFSSMARNTHIACTLNTWGDIEVSTQYFHQIKATFRSDTHSNE